jgi:hypothetical protein
MRSQVSAAKFIGANLTTRGHRNSLAKTAFSIKKSTFIKKDASSRLTPAKALAIIALLCKSLRNAERDAGLAQLVERYLAKV